MSAHMIISPRGHTIETDPRRAIHLRISCLHVATIYHYNAVALRGLAKWVFFLSKNANKYWICINPPTHHPSKHFFLKPSLTWTEHSNHNNQTRLAMYADRIHMIYSPKYQYWFRAILGRFSTQKFRVRPGAKIIKTNTKLDSKQTSNVPC